MELATQFDELLRTIWTAVSSFPRKSDPMREDFIVTTFARVLDLGDAYAQSLAAKIGLSLPLLARSMFEASVDLRLMVQDPEYHKRWHAQGIRQRELVLNAADRHTDSPLFEGIRAAMERHPNRLRAGQNTNQVGNSRESLEAKCRKLDILAEYDLVYRMLSPENHNDALAVGVRHLKFNDGTTEVLGTREFATSDYNFASGVAADLLHGSTHRVWKFFGLGEERLHHVDASHEALMATLDQEWTRFRKSVPSEDPETGDSQPA